MRVIIVTTAIRIKTYKRKSRNSMNRIEIWSDFYIMHETLVSEVFVGLEGIYLKSYLGPRYNYKTIR